MKPSLVESESPRGGLAPPDTLIQAVPSEQTAGLPVPVLDPATPLLDYKCQPDKMPS